MKSAHTTPGTLRRQRGAVTLIISLIILFGVTLVVFVTANSTLVEIRMSANEARARHAFAAAEAGVDYAIAHFSESGPRDGDGDLMASADLLHSADLANGSSYKVRFCGVDATLNADADCTCTGADPTGRQARIYSCGWSDDGTAVRRLSVAASGLPAIPGNGPEMALISRGTANALTGNATVINYYTDITIWTGLSVAGQSNTSTTLIRDADESFPQPVADDDSPCGLTWPDAPSFGNAQCNNAPAGYVCTSQGSDFGPDVIHSDTSLSALSDDNYFQNTFGVSPADYKASMEAANIIAGADVGDASGAGAAGQAYWVDGDANIGGGTFGTSDNPVVMIVDGDLTIGGTAEINGVVFVTGDLAGSGTPEIHGSMVVAGQTNINAGNVKLIFDPNAVCRAGDGGGRKGTSVAGTWRDWLAQ